MRNCISEKCLVKTFNLKIYRGNQITDKQTVINSNALNTFCCHDKGFQTLLFFNVLTTYMG